MMARWKNQSSVQSKEIEAALWSKLKRDYRREKNYQCKRDSNWLGLGKEIVPEVLGKSS